jgi:hypothetical protein
MTSEDPPPTAEEEAALTTFDDLPIQVVEHIAAMVIKGQPFRTSISSALSVRSYGMEDAYGTETMLYCIVRQQAVLPPCFY